MVKLGAKKEKKATMELNETELENRYEKTEEPVELSAADAILEEFKKLTLSTGRSFYNIDEVAAILNSHLK